MTLSLSAGLLVGMAASLILVPVCNALMENRQAGGQRVTAPDRKPDATGDAVL